MAEKKTFSGKILSDEVLDAASAQHAVRMTMLATGVSGTSGVILPKDGPTGGRWADDDAGHTNFIEVAQETFIQAWNEGDSELSEQQAFQVAMEAMREVMEDSGLALDNVETDFEMALEVFCNAVEDGEDALEAFAIACETLEEAYRDNFAERDGD